MSDVERWANANRHSDHRSECEAVHETVEDRIRRIAATRSIGLSEYIGEAMMPALADYMENLEEWMHRDGCDGSVGVCPDDPVGVGSP